MTHRYTAASDGWLAFITPARQLFVGGAPDAATIERLWARIREEQGPAGVLETLAEGGIFATPPFAFVELGDAEVEVIVRGDASVQVGEERVSGAGATTWIERRLPGSGVAVSLAGSGRLELPIEVGVVRASAFASGGGALPAVVPVAAVAEAAPAPAPEPEAAVPDPAAAPALPAGEAFPDATIPLAQYIAEEEARSRAAAQAEQPRVSEETVVELPEVAGAEPAHAAAGEEAAAGEAAADTGGYDYLFGATVYHNVQDAAVHTAEPEEADDEAAPATPVEGDHDGNTVLTSSLSRPGRVRRPRGEAAPAAPVVAVVLPDGAREVLDEALVLGRSPSVSGVPGGQLPRLVTVPGGDQDISRSHVRIALEGGTVVVTDLHSRNGTVIVLPGGDKQKLRAGEPTPVIVGTIVDLGGGIELRIEEL